MLGLLLALNDTPLIVDQPEDDLDTKLISSFVVEGFKKLKKKRQSIFVTLYIKSQRKIGSIL